MIKRNHNTEGRTEPNTDAVRPFFYFLLLKIQHKSERFANYANRRRVRIMCAWCGWWDLNPHGVTQRCLRPPRLPFRHTRIFRIYETKILYHKKNKIAIPSIKKIYTGDNRKPSSPVLYFLSYKFSNISKYLMPSKRSASREKWIVSTFPIA